MLGLVANRSALLGTLTCLVGVLGVSLLLSPPALSGGMNLRSSTKLNFPAGVSGSGVPTTVNGSPVNPNGGFTTNPDGTINAPPGTTITPSGFIISPNGQQLIAPTGVINTNGGFTTNPDGTITAPASSTINPNYQNSSGNCQQINPSGTVTGVRATPQSVPTNSNGQICY
jgi:hypothetical protein